jgi:hypothetical protein
MLFGAGNTLAFILAAMALGYFICVKANKEQGFLKVLGLVLGTIIIVVTLLLSTFIIGLGFSKPPVMRQQNTMMGTRPMMPSPPAMPKK